MQYLFLLYLDPSAPQTEEQRAKAMRDHWALMDEAVANGAFHGASPVQTSLRTVVSRNGDGTLAVTDGPFAETKEVMGGYYLLDCAGIETATTYGRRLASTGRVRTVDIRPLAPLPPRL